eukprot:1147447-Pelagomonas_calceolata.AAC.1
MASTVHIQDWRTRPNHACVLLTIACCLLPIAYCTFCKTGHQRVVSAYTKSIDLKISQNVEARRIGMKSASGSWAQPDSGSEHGMRPVRQMVLRCKFRQHSVKEGAQEMIKNNCAGSENTPHINEGKKDTWGRAPCVPFTKRSKGYKGNKGLQ